MNILGNFAWIVFGGIIIALEYLLFGLTLCVTVIGIPPGIQLFKLAGLALFPFSREVTENRSGSGVFSLLMNVLWAFTFGLVIGLTHLVLALILTLTILGIPFAEQHVRLAQLAVLPFGKEVVSG